MDYMFPGSDDDLGMEDMDSTDELERQTGMQTQKLCQWMVTHLMLKTVPPLPAK